MAGVGNFLCHTDPDPEGILEHFRPKMEFVVISSHRFSSAIRQALFHQNGGF
jgi:hypothetical protein